MAQSRKQRIKTTDRGGPARVAFGCLLLGLGLAWSLALLMNTASAWRTLSLLRDLAHGLGGVLCAALPLFALTGGGLLCASARRRISPRVYLCLLGMYLCLLAILTLATSIGTRDNTLMNYIGSYSGGTAGDASYGAFLRGAYLVRGFNGGRLAGGGLLGMLLAYPVYLVLNVAGGVTLLALVMLALLLVLLRLNPADSVAALVERSAARKAGQQQAEEEGEAPPPAWQPTAEVPPAEPLIRPQTVQYTTTSVQSEPVADYLIHDEDLSRTPPVTPQERGFVPVQTGELYEEHIPVAQEAPRPQPAPSTQPAKPAEQPPQAQAGRRTRRQRAQEREQPAEPQPIPQPMPQPAQAAMPKEASLPWYTRNEDIPPIAEEADAVEQTQLPLPRMRTGAVSAARHSSGEARQVHTDPAVPLTGERISIHQDEAKGPKEDPFAAKHTAEAIRQMTGKYEAPPLSLLREPVRQRVDTSQEDNDRAAVLQETLATFNIGVSVEYVVHGPAITRFALKLADGVNVNRLNNLANNLAMSMKAVGLRLEIPIPGTNLVGIEVPNEKVSMVTLKEVLDSPVMRANPSPTAVAIGKDVTGTPILCELSDMPHLLIAGATGSGKSVCINSIIQSILYRATPQQVRMIMIDPKLVELQPYNGIPHLLTEVVSDPKKAAAALDWLVQEMTSRYTRFQQAGVRNIAGFNKKTVNPADRMPDIVAIIDEFSDLMVQCRKQVEESIQRLAALARAAGIYLIVATQRPSVDVITGVIKANIPSRIAFAVANNVDSRTIIDSVGAERLLGKGDMLYFPRSEFRPIRVQGCFVSDTEVQDIADFVKQNNDALYDEGIDEHMRRAAEEEEAEPLGKEIDYENQADTENELLQRAIEMAVETGQMSISQLRRSLGLGHSRAGKLIDTMARMGVVSQDEGPKPRRTLITREDYLRMQAEILDQ